MKDVQSRRGVESRWIRRGSAKKGCLIALAAFLLLVGGLSVWVMMSWKSWTAAGVTAITTGVLEDANLPPDQKTRILAKVTSVAEDFKSGKITTTQFKGVLKEIAEGPILPLALVGAMNSEYVQKSALTPEEKTAADRTLQRFTRGLIEKKITHEDAQRVLTPMSVQHQGKNQGFRLKQPQEVTPDELRKSLAGAKLKADEAKIPDEDFAFDIATELERAVNEALGRK